jgi:hypothetical protein
LLHRHVRRVDLTVVRSGCCVAASVFSIVRFVQLFRFVSIIDYSRPSVSIFVPLVALSSRVSCVYHAFVTLVSVFVIERSRGLGLGRPTFPLSVSQLSALIIINVINVNAKKIVGDNLSIVGGLFVDKRRSLVIDVINIITGVRRNHSPNLS